MVAKIKTTSIVQNLGNQVSNFKNRLSSIGQRLLTTAQQNIRQSNINRVNRMNQGLQKWGQIANTVVNKPFERIGADITKAKTQLPPNMTKFQQVKTLFPVAFSSVSKNIYKDIPGANLAARYAGNVGIGAGKTLASTYNVGKSLGKGDFKGAANHLINTAVSGLGTVFRINPTTGWAPAFLAYDTLKSGSAAKIRGKSYPEQLKAAGAGFVGDEYTGIGTATTTDPKTEQFLNTAEGVAFLGFALYQGWKGFKNWNDLRLKKIAVRNTAYAKDLNTLQQFGFQEGDFGNKEIMKSKLMQVNRQYGGISKLENQSKFGEFMKAFNNVMNNHYDGVPKININKTPVNVKTQPTTGNEIVPVSTQPAVISPLAPASPVAPQQPIIPQIQSAIVNQPLTNVQVGITSAQPLNPITAAIIKDGNSLLDAGKVDEGLAKLHEVTINTQPELQQLLNKDGVTQINNLDTNTHGLYFGNPEPSFWLNINSNNINKSLNSIAQFAKKHQQESFITAQPSILPNATPGFKIEIGRPLSNQEVLNIEKIFNNNGIGLTLNQKTGEGYALNIKEFDSMIPDDFLNAYLKARIALNQTGINAQYILDKYDTRVYNKGTYDKLIQTNVGPENTTVERTTQTGRQINPEAINATGLNAGNLSPNQIQEKVTSSNLPSQGEAFPNSIENQIKRQQSQTTFVPPTPPQTPPQRPSINFTPLNPQDPFYNIERMNIPAQEKQNIVEMFTKLKPEIEAVVGDTLTNEQVKEAARFISDDLIKLVGREKTEELAASQISLRQKIAGLASDYSEAGTKELIQAIIRDKAFGEHIARILQARNINIDPANPQDNLRKYVLGKIFDVVKDEEKIIAAANQMSQADWQNSQKIASFYRQFVKPTAEEIIDKLRYSAMLSSPNTHLINIGSNLQGTGFLLPVQKTIEGTIDSFLSGMSMGKRPRTRFTGEGLAYAKAYYNKETGKQAAKQFYNIMRGVREGNYPDIPREAALFPNPGILNTVEKSMSFVLNSLFGEDGYFSIRTQAGLKAAYKYRASKGVNLEDIENIIPQESKKALFNSPMYIKKEGIINSALGAGGRWVQGATHSPSPLFRWLAKLSIPFIRIGTNLLKAGVEGNPVSGTVNLIGNEDKIAGLAKILMGSGVMAIAVIGLAKKRIKLHAWAPADPTKRQAQYDAGILPWSIEVTLPGGKRESIQFSRLHPLISFQLGMVAAVDQAWRENRLSEDKGATLLEATAGILKFVADQSYFKNLGDMTNLIQGDLSSWPSLISNYPSQLIPFRAFQGWFTRIIDKYQHKPEEGAGLLKQVLQNIQSGIPLLSQGVPQRTDAYGRPVEYPQRFFNAISPVRVSPIKPQEEEIFNLYMENAQLNEAIKKDESAMLKTGPGMVSAKAVDEKMSSKKQELLEKKARNEVTLYHIPQAINGKYIYWDDEAGAVKTISSTLDLKELEKLSPAGQQLSKQDAEYKYMTKLTTSSGIDPNFIKQESERLGISVDDATYDMLTRLEDTLQIEEIKNNIQGLTGEELQGELVAMRRVSDGSQDPLLTDTLIGKLVKEGVISDSLGDYLKTVGWDTKTKDFTRLSLGSGKKPSLKKFSVPKAGVAYKKADLSFVKNMTPKTPGIKELKGSSNFVTPKLPTSAKTGSISIKSITPKVKKFRKFSVKK